MPQPLITTDAEGVAHFYLLFADRVEGLDSIAALHSGLTAHGIPAKHATLLIAAANCVSVRDEDFQAQLERVG